MAAGLPAKGYAAPGDHLQSTDRLWLPGHQLERGEAPWRDSYSFQPAAERQENFAAWPFGLAFWPLHALLGSVGAWNAFVLLSYVASGTFVFLWLRALGLAAPAALAGGLAYALAPYLAAQLAAGHLLAPAAMLLPLALWLLERGWWPAAAVAVASIPLAGQVHLALAAIPFFAAYALARRQAAAAVAGGALAVAAGALVYVASIRGTIGARGRSFAQVERYSAEAADLVSRDVRHGIESFVFLGWLVPLLAVAGLTVLLRPSNTLLLGSARRLAFVLAAGAVFPVVLALGSNTPLYEPLWEHGPGLRDTRVPARMLPIACLCLAALAALAVERVRWRLAAPLAVAMIALDLRWDVTLFRPTAADEDNPAYAALREQLPGRLLEIPVLLPDRQEGSVYLYYAMQAPRERVLGYSTTAPPAADALARRVRRDLCTALRELRVRAIMYLSENPVNVCGARRVYRDARFSLFTYPSRESRSRRRASSR